MIHPTLYDLAKLPAFKDWVVPLNQIQTKYWFKGSMLELPAGRNDFTSAFLERMPDSHRPLVSLLWARLGKAKYRMSAGLVWFLATEIDRPAKSLLWAYGLAHAGLELNVDHLTLEFFSNVWGKGMPTDEGYRQCWEAQKVKAFPENNWLSDDSSWIEMEFKPHARTSRG